ncbi:hypothetical protein HC928_22770 [bacterium]|nr:hypothetical protein [bacterium]
MANWGFVGRCIVLMGVAVLLLSGSGWALPQADAEPGGPRAQPCRPRRGDAAKRGAPFLNADGPAQEDRVQEAYGQLPLYFEPKRGQVVDQVAYLARSAGYTLFLTEAGAAFSLVLDLGERELRVQAPYTYQQVAGREVKIASRFVLESGMVHFALGRMTPASRSSLTPPSPTPATSAGAALIVARASRWMGAAMPM